MVDVITYVKNADISSIWKYKKVRRRVWKLFKVGLITEEQFSEAIKILSERKQKELI